MRKFYGAVLSAIVMISSVMSVGCGKTEEQKPAEVTETTEVTEVTETSENEIAETAEEVAKLPKGGKNALLPAEEEIRPESDLFSYYGVNNIMTPMTVAAMHKYLMAAAEYEGISVGIENMTKGEFAEWLSKVWTPEIDAEFCQKMECDSDEAYTGLKMCGYKDGWSRELHDKMVAEGKWSEYTFFENWREEHPGEYTELEK